MIFHRVAPTGRSFDLKNIRINRKIFLGGLQIAKGLIKNIRFEENGEGIPCGELRFRCVFFCLFIALSFF